MWQIGKGCPPLMGSPPPSSCTFPVCLSLITCRAAWVSRFVGNGFCLPRTLKDLCFVVFCDEWEMQTSESQLFLFENEMDIRSRGTGVAQCWGQTLSRPLAVLSTGTSSTYLASDLQGASNLLFTISTPQLVASKMVASPGPCLQHVMKPRSGNSY